MTRSGENTVYVWDKFVRVFHWSLVIAFFTAYFLDEEEVLGIHVNAGYVVLALVVMRIIWGFIGTHYARFSDFVYSPARIAAFLRGILRGRPERFLGHNPAGGLMILLLLASLLATTITGVALYGADQHAGPLAAMFTGVSEHDPVEHALEEIHEFFANFTVFLVVIHILGVFVEGRLHGENLVKAMFTGYKRA